MNRRDIARRRHNQKAKPANRRDAKNAEKTSFLPISAFFASLRFTWLAILVAARPRRVATVCLEIPELAFNWP